LASGSSRTKPTRIVPRRLQLTRGYGTLHHITPPLDAERPFTVSMRSIIWHVNIIHLRRNLVSVYMTPGSDRSRYPSSRMQQSNCIPPYQNLSCDTAWQPLTPGAPTHCRALPRLPFLLFPLASCSYPYERHRHAKRYIERATMREVLKE